MRVSGGGSPINSVHVPVYYTPRPAVGKADPSLEMVAATHRIREMVTPLNYKFIGRFIKFETLDVGSE